MSSLRRAIARSRFAAVAAFPLRASLVGRHVATVVYRAIRWLVRSREHTNFTYHLTERNREHLAWWIATIVDTDVATIREYMRELDEDEYLRHHIESTTDSSDRRGIADREARFGRRMGWYAFVRALKPEHIVETGTDKGHGACVFAAALLRNGYGRLTTIDVNPDSGYLLTDRYAEVAHRSVGDSVSVIKAGNEPVDLFLHDSLHSPEHEAAELEAVAPRLSPHAVVLSDNAHATDALMNWAVDHKYRFLFFREVPEDHWYPGSGIGAAWHPRPRA